MAEPTRVHPLEDDFPFEIVSHLVPVVSFREYPRAIIDEQNGVRLAVKQYIPRHDKTPKSKTEPITIIAAGGLGFFKELYEPFFAEFLHRAHRSGVNIRSIWMADMFNVGESAVANKDNLGCDPAWIDHSRDLWSMINHFRAEMPKPIIGLGHSMGCNQIVCLSSWHPTLFHSLVFIEPGIDPQYGRAIAAPWRFHTLRLQESWSNREEAEARLVKFHKAHSWDEKTLARLKHYGILRAEENKSDTWNFATSKHQIVSLLGRHNPKNIGLGPGGVSEMTLEERESIPDSDPDSWNEDTFYKPELKLAWEYLPSVRPWVLYVNGGDSPVFGCPLTRDERARRTGTGVGGNGGLKLGAVRQVIIDGAGHSMVFDGDICIVAEHVVEWLTKECERWTDVYKRRLKDWQKRRIEKQQTVEDEYAAAVNLVMKQEKRTGKL